MSQKNETTVLVLAFLITVALLGAGFWWFTRSSGFNPGTLAGGGNENPQNQPQASPNSSNQSTSSSPSAPSSTFTPPMSVASGTTVRIKGSTSMVQINQALKGSFEKQFPGTTINTQARGTEKGIQELQVGIVDIAAISRPLTSQEQSQGLTAVPVAKDAIAIVVGDNNPYQRQLYYVYKQPASPQVQAFLGYLNSPQGQQAIAPTN